MLENKRGESDLSKGVMRRIYAVWFLKKITSPLWLKGYIAIILTWQFGVQVHVASVLHNAPGATNLPKNLVFLTRAFTGTDFMVQAIIILGFVTGALFFRDMIGRVGYQHLSGGRA